MIKSSQEVFITKQNIDKTEFKSNKQFVVMD